MFSSIFGTAHAMETNGTIPDASIATVKSDSTKTKRNKKRVFQFGKASFYAYNFHGRKTASGERFNQNELTAAHKTLPFGTKVKVTNVNNGKFVIVRINDHGPYIKGRIIDLTRKAAAKLDMIKAGTASVSLEIIG